MQEITVTELKTMMDNQEDFQLIDIREFHEVETASIGAEHIPMGDIIDNLDKISKEKTVVIHCKSGARSANIINLLSNQFGFNNLYNLKGGIIAWADQIDSSVPKY